MTVNETSSVITESKVVLGLDIEVDDAEDTVGRKQRGERVDDGVVVGLKGACQHAEQTPEWHQDSTYDHGQAVRHGDKVGAAMLGPLLVEVAHGRRSEGSGVAG